MNMPVIQSVGAPPERHADRIISEMVRWLEGEATRLLPRINALWPRGALPPGSRKAQLRLAERLRAIARPTMLDMTFEPGGRGKFRFTLLVWGVKSGAKPQVYLGRQIIEGTGNYRFREDLECLLTVSHHAMSRLAQRCDVRTPLDLYAALTGMAQTVVVRPDEPIPPAGMRLAFPGGIAVLRRDSADGGLVAVTALEPKEEEVQWTRT
jgi:hypothetical protein